ncbi:A/G-specific adenine glycosylase [bacterium]|nr:A/G-specific adenine glycosylase [bacterium]
MIVQPAIKKTLASRLLEWFAGHKRPMPWRQTTDPYRIWISEMMLQQTQVATVEPYFLRFIGKFPTLQTLAAADLGDVMKSWEGLGYYSRARNMHRAAGEMMQRFRGQIPDNLEDLISLPGIGRYTAGAILSIAFGRPAPILDGNVIRVLTRLFHITDNTDKAATRTLLWFLAAQILPGEQDSATNPVRDRMPNRIRIREFNEALMELGALLCKTRSPACPVCPLNTICEAHRLGIQESLPVRNPRKPVPHFDVTAGIIWKADRFLITLRPPKGLLGGLWEFPGGKKEPGESLEKCLNREILEELNIHVQVKQHLISVRHAYTHFKITLHVFECDYQGGELRMDPDAAVDFRWIRASQLEQFAFPGADRKVIELIEKTHLK